MPDLDYTRLASDIGRLLIQAGNPVPFLFVSDTITDSDGARDVLRDIWQHPQADELAYVQVGLSPASAAGVYRSDGPTVTNNVGNPIPAGGAYLYLYSVLEVRQFRIQATTAGATMILTATAYRTGQGSR